jgi:hypothetical protein
MLLKRTLGSRSAICIVNVALETMHAYSRGLFGALTNSGTLTLSEIIQCFYCTGPKYRSSHFSDSLIISVRGMS